MIKIVDRGELNRVNIHVEFYHQEILKSGHVYR